MRNETHFLTYRFISRKLWSCDFASPTNCSRCHFDKNMFFLACLSQMFDTSKVWQFKKIIYCHGFLSCFIDIDSNILWMSVQLLHIV